MINKTKQLTDFQTKSNHQARAHDLKLIFLGSLLLSPSILLPNNKSLSISISLSIITISPFSRDKRNIYTHTHAHTYTPSTGYFQLYCMMPQVDLETLVSACAGGSCDSKIACETLAGVGDGDASHTTDQDQNPDFPPDSFWLSKDAELDWFDRNAFLERKESGKANSNSTNLNPNLNPSSNSNSQRFCFTRKSKASILGLPKTQKSSFVDAKYRKKTKPENTRLFPKRTGSVGKSGPNVIEPSSPKVSCMGRVRSKKDRNRRHKKQHRSREPGPDKAKPEGKQKSGFFASFRCIFRTGCHSQRGFSVDNSYAGSPPRSSVAVSHDIRERLPASDVDAPSSESLPRRSVSESEPVGLGTMKRFASGRKSDAWANDVA